MNLFASWFNPITTGITRFYYKLSKSEARFVRGIMLIKKGGRSCLQKASSLPIVWYLATKHICLRWESLDFRTTAFEPDLYSGDAAYFPMLT